MRKVFTITLTLVAVFALIGCSTTVTVEEEQSTYKPNVTPTESTPSSNVTHTQTNNTQSQPQNNEPTWPNNTQSQPQNNEPAWPNNTQSQPQNNEPTWPNNTQSQPQNNEPSWANESIRAEGQGAVDMSTARNSAQAKLKARRAAQLDANRQLIERILGLRIDSKTLVRDFVTESDTIEGFSSGIIKNFNYVGEHFNQMEGIYTVTAEVKLYSLWEKVKSSHTFEE